MLPQELSCLDNGATVLATIALGGELMGFQVDSHVVLFMGDMGLTELAHVFAFSGPLGVRLYHVWMKQKKKISFGVEELCFIF